MMISRDALTATKLKLATPSYSRTYSGQFERLGDYQFISSIGVVAAGGGATGPAGVREKRGAGAA